jgi:Holliday junction resolvasome RuvABC ATP-dependent DNA helicase subunit
MNAQEYTSVSIARWIVARLRSANDFACEGLPLIDLDVLFGELGRDTLFAEVAAEFSIALAGFEVTTVDMELAASRCGLKGIRAFADDLHMAAQWRNDRDNHPRTIALAMGYNAGVHTLGHYARPQAHDLARILLEDARDQLSVRFPRSPDVHRQLLSVLATESAVDSLLSLESCADFLARWDALREQNGNHAPWQALPALGLLQDRELFGKDDLAKRLARNLEIAGRVRTLRVSELRNRANRKYRDPERQRKMTIALGEVDAYLQAIQQGRTTTLDLSDALMVVQPPKEPKEEPPEEPDDPDDPTPNDDGDQETPPSLPDESADALLDGRDDDLAAIADALEEGWEDAQEDRGGFIDVEATLADGKQVEARLDIDLAVLDWVEAFCADDRFGGWFETTETETTHALKTAADHSPVFLRADAIITVEGEAFSLETILGDWDKELPGLVGSNTRLAPTWREFRALRASLLPHLGKLVFHARHWLDGRPKVLAHVRRYLELAACLYRETQEHYQVMASVSTVWARAALEALLALDTIQIRAVRADGKPLAKAVLLPTHPLHLWRNERLSTLLRGLANSSPIDRDERETIRRELERPEQFLSVVRLSSLPEGRGLGQLLPYTNQIAGLPIFENLRNSCSGADGVRRLGEALDHFVIHNPNRPFPLRLAVVNPPAGDDLPSELVKLLKKPQYRSGQRLSSIHLDLYATGQHIDRLRGSLRFTKTQREDEVQEKVAAGRLLIRTHDDDASPGTSLEQVVGRLRERPSHLVALFDESTVELRQRTVGKMLPMSPFCVRYDVQVDKFSGGIRLEPQPGESPFSEFLQLMNELEGHQRDGAVQAYADAEGLAKIADSLLQGEHPASTWLFLADRALPSEAGMHSVRIWEQREGLRDTFLAARDFRSLARLLRPKVANRANLRIEPGDMERLLHQGARLLGTGLLSLVKKQDGQPDEKQVIGFSGLLFAARDFQRRLPGALVLSVDHPLAKLWLRTGKKGAGVRCDLLVLWRNRMDNRFELTAVEVKASDSDSLNDSRKRIPQAIEQIGHTLEAIEDGLAGSGDAPPSPLSVPRCEMLKQTLARAAQSRTGSASVDRENRKRWGSWLQDLFAESAPPVSLKGCVVSVLLRRASRGTDEPLESDKWPMVHRVLGELELDELLHDLKSAGSASAGSSGPKGEVPKGGAKHGTSSDAEIPYVSSNRSERTSPVVDSTPEIQTSVPRLDADSDRVVRSDPEDEDPPAWPPAVNALGLIGQDEAVKRLVEQAVFAHTTGQRFPDKLLVGPAGVGKSTLARKIGKLLNHEPLFFSGADLRKPSDLVQRLKEKQLLEEVGDTVLVAPAILFIDEVHGISPVVATSLLSAMDDRRTTTIDGRLYDFNQAVLLLATTDPGKLSEAFQSRPDKTWLRPYTLHELAGILWLHGKDCLNGSELAQQACYEIAARNQCNPRRSVRQLTQTLVPHFFSRAMEVADGKPTLKDTAAWITQEHVARFYDDQGTDANGLDDVALRFLKYLKQQGAASEPTLRQALGLAHPKDFVETAEYLVRLGLIETSSAGRRLTRQGERYLKSDTPPDLRSRISRAH